MNVQSIGHAAALYKNSANLATEGVSKGTQDKVSFGAMVDSAVDQLIETQQRSEQLSAEAVTGKADITEVVQAVTEAEVTLQTVVAVRDRVISAYQDIMRMPI